MSTTINRAYETNNYSIISKYSASKAGYCKDEILEDFVENWLDRGTSNSTGSCCRRRRRTPLVNRGYAARMLAMDWIITRAICCDQINCFIVLGAGFDTISLQPSRRARGCCHWIEIDLPQVIETKCAYIKTRWQLEADSQISTPAQGITSFLPLRCHLISCDLTNDLELHQKLNTLFMSNGIPSAEIPRNVCLVNEVCLCYLEEQVKGEESSAPGEMAEIMRNHFESLGHPLKFFPTRQEMRAHYFERCQFQALTILPMYQIYHNVLQPKRNDLKLEALEPFDEFEEMDLYLSHYALVMGQIRLRLHSDIIPSSAHHDDDESMSELCNKLASSNVQVRCNHQARKLNDCHAIRRYGHAACVLEDTANVRVALLSGGFGDSGDTKNQLTRLNDCLIVSQVDNQQQQQTVQRIPFEGATNDSDPIGRMYGQVCPLESQDSTMLFFNGGRTSPLKRPEAINNSCIYRLHDNNNQLSLVNSFKTTSLRWRHRLVKLNSTQVIQAGGISGLTLEQQRPATPPLIMWNFSSDKLGQWQQVTAIRDLEQFERHSFGMATNYNQQLLLIFGGLRTAAERPAHSGLLYDLRNSSGTPEVELEDGVQVFGHQVHFINDNQFVRVGGVSSQWGLPESSVELFDLRGVGGRSRVGIFEPLECDQSNGNEMSWMPINLDSLKFESTRQIVSFGGGGNYFTFGTSFNSTRLVYNYES